VKSLPLSNCRLSIVDSARSTVTFCCFVSQPETTADAISYKHRSRTSSPTATPNANLKGRPMKKALSAAIAAYRKYRTAKANSRAYRILRYLPISIVVSYVVLLCFPQVLFAHEISYRNLDVYSMEPLDPNVYAVLDRVEFNLATSEINTQEVKPRIFVTNGFSLYAMLSLYVGSNSFGKGYAALHLVISTDRQIKHVFYSNKIC
jgi:hypothetical protein